MLSITTGPSLFGSSTCTGQRQKQNQTACNDGEDPADEAEEDVEDQVDGQLGRSTTLVGAHANHDGQRPNSRQVNE